MAITFPKDFDSLLSWAETNYNKHLNDTEENLFTLSDFTFIGTGVQNNDKFISKILILGMEPGIGIDVPDDINDAEFKASKEYLYFKRIAIDNLNDWKGIAKRNQEELLTGEKLDKQHELPHTDYDYKSPYFPYPGLAFKRPRPAATWYNYQKLMNSIIEEWHKYHKYKVSDVEVAKTGEDYNIHKYAFLSDISALPSKKMNGWHNAKDSIFRRRELFKQAFFQNFPIVIVAPGKEYLEKYHRESGTDYITDIFNVTSAKSETILSGECSADLQGFIYGIYVDETNSKLVINTKHFTYISNEALSIIAKLIVEFAVKNNIQLLPSDKEYNIIDGFPEELKEDKALKEWLDFFARHQIEPSFRILKANEPLTMYIDSAFASDADAKSRLKYPEIYVHLKCNNSRFRCISENICLNRLSPKLRELRPDERVIDGFYQANYPIGAMIRFAREFVITRESHPSVDIDRNSILEISNFLFGCDDKLE